MPDYRLPVKDVPEEESVLPKEVMESYVREYFKEYLDDARALIDMICDDIFIVNSQWREAPNHDNNFAAREALRTAIRYTGITGLETIETVLGERYSRNGENYMVKVTRPLEGVFIAARHRALDLSKSSPAFLTPEQLTKLLNNEFDLEDNVVVKGRKLGTARSITGTIPPTVEGHVVIRSRLSRKIN